MDIDAYAGCASYAELLRASGQQAQAISTAPPNESVTPTIRSWATAVQSVYTPSQSDTFTLIDVSDPDYVDRIVDFARVDEVIDHHPGFEEYWRQRLGDAAQLEIVGAACTQIFERWEESGLPDSMSVLSARLLMCGILDNTLNFGAKITTDRDIRAYESLRPIADLPNDWPAQYFADCQSTIENNIPTAIHNDSKQMSFQTLDRPLCVGQLAVWDGRALLACDHDVFRQTLANQNPHWFMNIISIGEAKSYFMSDDIAIQAWLSQLLAVQFDGSVAEAERMWLRKEIARQDSDASRTDTELNTL
jgi:nanoRNase/pAp phosphatase (c-di-AMP/oligoRNAs hydrolase)